MTRVFNKTPTPEQSALLVATLDGLSDGVWIWDIASGRVEFSDKWVSQLGYERQEVEPSYTFWEQLVHPEDLPSTRELIDIHFANSQPGFLCEYRLRSKQGDYRWSRDRGEIVARDEAGKPLRMVCTNTDITEQKIAEEDARRGRRRLDLALAAGSMGTWEWDIPTDVVTWSDTVYRLLGYQKDQFGGTLQAFIDIVHPDEREQAGRKIQSNLASDVRDFELESNVIRGDGSDIWIYSKGTIHRNKQGQATGVTGVVSDITPRKRQELDLAFIADLQQRLDDASSIDELMQIATQRTAKHLGLSRCSLVEVDSDEATAEVKSEYHLPSDDGMLGVHRLHDFLTDKECALIADGDQVTIDDTKKHRVSSQVENLRKYGIGSLCSSGYSIAKGFHVFVSAIRSHSHVWQDDERELLQRVANRVCIRLERARHVQALAERESRLRTALEALSQTNAKLQTLFDATETFMGVVDLDGVVHEVNETATSGCGYHREEVVNKPFWDCPWWSGSTAVREQIRDSVRRAKIGETVSRELDYWTGEGQQRKVSYRITPAYDDHGKIVFLVASGIDVTEQLRFEKSLQISRHEAEAANHAKSEFLANMSHEIRTPMTAILGYADLLAEGEADSKKLEYVATIRRNGDFLLEIINDILDLSKIEAGKLQMSTGLFSPRQLVEEVRSVMDVRASEKELTLSVEYASELPAQIHSDPKRLKQILINLVGNAIKFTKQGSVRVSVSFIPTESKLRFEVVDSGIGIDPARQTELFKPFIQGDSSVTRKYGGSGLGLAISQRLAKRLGGQIDVQSEPGKGSRFTLEIDAGDLSKQTSIPSVRQSTDASDGQVDLPLIELDCQILVVDDRRDIRFLSKRLLSKAGARVTEAEDGIEAIETVEAASEGFDLILLDMQMPRLDGYQTAQRLREIGFEKPIIALTADAMQGDMRRCLQCGCDDYLSKPIDARRLLTMVSQMVP